MNITKFESFNNLIDDDDEIKKSLFGKYYTIENNYVNIKNKILNMISDWYNNKIIDFYITKNDKFPLCLKSSFKDSIYIEPNDFKDLLKYMEDPNLYKSAKKYNIL
jgi:hypothetical protein